MKDNFEYRPIIMAADVYIATEWIENKLPDPKMLDLLGQTTLVPMRTEEMMPILASKVSLDGEWVAYIELNRVKVDPKLYIREFVVNPNHRGKGLGKRIILELLSTTKESGLNRVELEPRAESIDFWTKLGFTHKVEGKPNIYLLM